MNPVVIATDNLTPTPTVLVTLDGRPYPTNAPITEEKREHEISATATDDGGNSASVGPFRFMLDKTRPVVTIVNAATDQPFPAGALFNTPVPVKVTVADVTNTTIAATLDGASFTLGASSVQPDGTIVFTPAPIGAEGTHSLSVVATDEVGLSNDPALAAFVIDMTPPHITFSEPLANATVGTIAVTVAGGADDAVTIRINGRDALVNMASKTFTIDGVALLEGPNDILAEAADAAGNPGTATLRVTLDTRVPELTITSPAADACVGTAALDVTGLAADPHLQSVSVTVGSNSPVAATIVDGAWSVSIPGLDEGKKLITVEAIDDVGHTTSASRSLVIDRIAPVIEVRSSGELFTATLTNRPVALFLRAVDADPNTVLSATLDGAPYASGASVATEGAHRLIVSALDCAGHPSQKTVDFTIDLTPPSIHNLNPANAATVGTMPASISGSSDSDTASVEISGMQLNATPAAGGSFTIAGVPFAEGSNRFTLNATDRAGNRSSLDYSVTVKTVAPVVEIRESGAAIPAGTLFNRSVTPVIRSADLQATIAATLNGATFTSGTTISSDGAYTLHATATDALGHAGTAEATFTIDRTPPVVTITSPVESTVQADHVEVRGTAGDSISATVNGQPVTLAADGSFVVPSFDLEVGPNGIVATGRDRAGNTGRDEVVVTRDDIGGGIILTYPPDRSLTNRTTTDVIGRLLNASRGTTVSIGGTNVPVDATGGFRVSGFALTEGENAITATSTATNGVSGVATTHVTADFTPPSLTILESDQPLSDGVRFAERAVISLQAADAGGGAVTTTLTIDGSVAAAPFTINAAGGHAVTATARDLAGNETRVERTLFIGAATGGATCQLDSFDPADGAVILSTTTTLVGRAGGAIGVKVNGIPALVADGAFRASVELPSEGSNTIDIVCTDADGNATGTPARITLNRVTGDPSISISSPAEDFVSAEETIAVTGTVGPGVVSADVNGVAAAIAGTDTSVTRPFTVPAVRLATGLNILVAHGRNAAGRVGTASRRGLYLKDAPSINISAPTSGSTTGTPSISVSGTWGSLDPATLTVENVTSGQSANAQFTRRSDTTGTFAATIPLVNGEQTLRVSGRDRLNRPATATTSVRLIAGNPGIAIAQPANHSSFGGGSSSVAVSGTFQAAPGSTVDVNGVSATLNGPAFNASVPFSTLAAGITPIVAAVTEPDGDSAFATIVVTQYADAPSVTEAFPAANAAEVDGGSLMLVLFSQPMDAATLSTAFRLEGNGGAPVSGSLYLDKDVLTFAPATMLAAGERYTLRVTTAAKNIAGTPLEAEYTSAFTVASTAPSTAPSVTPLGSAVCGQSITVAGTATAGARVRLESGALVLNTTADAAGAFTFNYPMSGQSGFTVIRVRTIGSDGSVSPAAELNVRVDCNGPSVLNASYDRAGNSLTIQFSEPIDAATATVGTNNSILLTLDDGRSVGGTAAIVQSLVSITPAESLSAKTFSLTVTTGLKDVIGNRLATPHTQLFSIGGGEPTPGDGSGFISGEVYDATTGRPLAGASMTIDIASPTPVTTSTDARGRYLARLPEGAHTIKAALTGYTTVFREIIVPAGAGVIPIDIRLTRAGDTKTAAGSAMALTHGGDSAVTKKIDLAIPSGALANGTKVTLTSMGGQALSGLLPLGWSPLGAAEVALAPDASPTSPLQLTFNVPATEISAAAQNLTAVQFDAARDEWRVIAAVVNIASDGKTTVPINGSGAYALAYPDKAPGLTVPPLPVAGDVLRGVPAAPEDAPELVKHDFVLEPSVILPTGRAVGTLRIEGSDASFPSGTAVQANIDEELRLADGSRLLDPPFATDLLLYRTLSGTLAVSDFHLAPTERAAQVVLETGVNHIRVFPYPGRLDRGTLIGSEGGRVPADDRVAVDIPSGAVPEPLRATAMSMSQADLDAIGPVAGFRIVGGFQLTLQRATEPPPADVDGDGQLDTPQTPELFLPARVTFRADASALPAPAAQVILAELLDQTPYGRMVRLAVPMMPVDGSQGSTPAIRFTTKGIDRAVLPVDGVVHEGRYLVLAAESPIAFATGTVRLAGATGRLLTDARVSAPPLGLADLSRTSGIYDVAVPAQPAAPFTLVPRHTSTGDGAVYTHAGAPEADAVVRVDVMLTPQPPSLGSVVVLRGDPPSQGALTPGSITTDVALTTNIRASFTPSIDPASVNADSIVVMDAITNTKVGGSAAADGNVAVVWTLTAGDRLKPNGRYTVSISPSIRAANGATLPRASTFTFTTVTEILNTEIHRDRIRITIPGADGISKIVGVAGALPAGWQAVAVRRHRDFIVRYQATAAGDGSFAFFIGNGGDDADRITIGDLIDLQVISNAGNIAAIFALTPFASEDGKSFVVPAGEAVRYTTPEGLTLDVPEGAFDVPTIIKMEAAQKQEFLDIPSLEADNDYIGSVRIEFEGTAKKPFNFEAPVPQGFDTGGDKVFLLAEKFDSVRGPRLAVIDLLRVDGGKLTTVPDPDDENQFLVVRNLAVGATGTLTGSSLRKYCHMLQGSGIYMYLNITQPVGGSVGFGVMTDLQAGYDLMWDIYASYIVPYTHIFEKGAALLPLVTGRRFTVIGVDPGTGLQAFSRTYDPIPFGPPGAGVTIEQPKQNDGGPYPVFGGPFRVEMLDLDVEDVQIRSMRNFNVELSNDIVRLTPGSPSLPAGTKVDLLNVTQGTLIRGTADASLTLSARVGDRIVALIEQHDIDPRSPVSIVFSEPIFTGAAKEPDAIDVYLHQLITVEYSPRLEVPSFSDITSQVRFNTDSGGRRVNITFASALQSEALYRVTLSAQIADVVKEQPGLTLGQGTVETDGVRSPVGGGSALQFFFDVKKPAGDLATFQAVPGNGFIRGMDLSGNILLVAAWGGGLHAYDLSNPATLTGTAAPLASLPGAPLGTTSALSVTIDRHNRVWTTEMPGIAGILRSYRVEDFANGMNPVPMKSSAIINWQMGFSNNIGLPSNTVLSDVPESIPFRVKLLLSDDETIFKNREEFVAGTGAMMTKDYPADDLQAFQIEIGKDATPYKLQRLTIENTTLDMHWSADATESSPATFTNVIARSGDKLRLLRNQKSWAVVAHLGYGIGIYDANALESNWSAKLYQNSPGHLKQQLVLTSGKIDSFCPNKTPDYGIIENYLTLDAELRGDPNNNQQVTALFTDTYRGVLDLQLTLPSSDGAPGTAEDDCGQRPNPNTGGLLFRTTPSGFEAPRMKALATAFSSAAGRAQYGQIGGLARYRWSVTAEQNPNGMRGMPRGPAEREYLLVSAADYGLVVVDMDSNPAVIPSYPLVNENIADVIWIPGGVVSVRVYQSANVALVGDRYGRALLVDLSRIDERWDAKNKLTSGLFETAARALQGQATDPYGVGADDPRILWKSEPGAIGGSVAPVFDPSTGMVFTGNGQKVKVLSALDPRVEVKVNLGETSGLSDVGGIVPLGIAPPQNIQQKIDALPGCGGAATLACKENASLAAFRLEVSLPGDMADALTQSDNELRLAIESERIPGAITEQTPNGFPRAHLRRTRRDGSAESPDRIPANFKMRRLVPEELRASLKMQRGYNRFISPWIVAIADPRASRDYEWGNASPEAKKEAGCEACDRPDHLKTKRESDGVYELWTNGRFISVRPELRASDQSIFAGTSYAYLGTDQRLTGRFSTIMADTVRPTEALVAAQNPPIAGGMLQDTTFLHSGEVEASHLDLIAGGRADLNVQFSRYYRSRTIGGTVLGQGWESPLLQRLRALPRGDVEYRDGVGEIWRFRPNEKNNGYLSPKGLFLKLVRTQRGWKLVDQQWRVTEFDDSGRVMSQTDEWFDPENPASGNLIRFVYDDSGRLSQIIDPVNRPSTLTYWTESEAGVEGAYPGLVKQLKDWRERTIEYGYDAVAGTLTSAKLPDVPNTSGGRPTVKYAYAAGGSFNDDLELRTNLRTITDPHEAASGGSPRVTFVYQPGGANRDRVTSQQWGSGETASFSYSGTEVNSTDVLGQARKYVLTPQPKDPFSDRAHTTTAVESGITTGSTPFGQLPSSLTAAAPVTADMDRTFSFTYDDEGQLLTSALPGVRLSTYSYLSVAPEAPGFIPKSTTTTGGPSSPVTEAIVYQAGPTATTFRKAYSANGITIDNPQPHRKNKSFQTTNDDVSVTMQFADSGLVTDVVSSGGTDTDGAGSQVRVSYAPANDSLTYRRAKPTAVDEGAGLRRDIQYPTRDRTTQTDARGIVTTTDFDSWERAIHVTTIGPGLTLDEKFEYDAGGRITKHIRKQGEALVTTSYAYDAVGRQVRVTTDNVAGVGSSITTTAYDLAGRKNIINHPGGASTTVELDGLGATIKSTLSTGGSPITEYTAYDLDRNVVYQTDLQTASAFAYDRNHERIGEMSSTGPTTTAEMDAWGRPTTIRTVDAAGGLTGESTLDYAPAGTVRSVTTKVDAATSRTIDHAWDGGGRTAGVGVGGRAVRSKFDEGNRLLNNESGEGTAAGLTVKYNEETITGHDGLLPSQIQEKDKAGSTYATSVQYNTEGEITARAMGNLEWRAQRDQAGNVVSAADPNRPARNYEYDSKGRLQREVLPGGPANDYAYDPSGGQTAYTDPSGETTGTETDLIGRPIKRNYKDGTTELIEWEGRRVKAITDRRGLKQTFTYNARGQINQVADAAARVLDDITYDDAGRIVRWKTPDAMIEYSDFDFDGHSRRTTQSRFRDNVLIDKYTQEHTFNVHGERTGFTMPSYAGFTSASPWTASVTQKRDGVGNVVRLDRTLVTGATSSLLEGDYRSSGRPDRRVITTAAGTTIVREYGYESGNGLLNRMSVSANGNTVAGSAVRFDGLQRSSAQLLGVSGGARTDKWEYDERSRLQSSILAADPASRPQHEQLTSADFRTAMERVPATPVDPGSILFTENPEGGHKIGSVQRDAATEQFAFTGGRRSEDGRFVYEYDTKGRVASVTQKSGGTTGFVRRIHYSYAGNNRMVGRLAEYAAVVAGTPPLPADWRIEDRPDILQADALPADSSFVWDPITDTIVAIFKTGSSEATTNDTNGGLVRQVMSGVFGYDDPIEVTAADAAGVKHLYPIFDEAGAGALHVILDDQGKIVTRSVAGGPYGEDSAALVGAAVDRVTIHTEKDAQGALAPIEIAIRLTEKIDEATLQTGVRLAAVDATGAVVRISGKVPALDGDATAQWSLTKTELDALTDVTPTSVGGKTLTASAVSIAVTSALRAAAWGNASSVLPAPAWAVATKPVHTSAALPVDVRESIVNVSQWLGSLSNGEKATSTLYEVPTLLALASRGSVRPQQQIVSSSFQALPFAEPATGLIYARARWMDPGTGTYLTPDPSGYRDSSNLYAVMGGDPVNNTDPTGLALYAFDGTGNNRAVMQGHETNVAKLLTAYGGLNTEYLVGVGTGGGWDTAVGGLTGWGISDRVQDALNRLETNYNAGDEVIDIIGFSRGAAAARDFANAIYEYGILDKRTGKRVRGMQIRFLGLFDTVGSVGIPGDEFNWFTKLEIPPNVEIARHAIAANEYRISFPLSHITKPGCPKGRTDSKEQVFEGAHSDVGGGYEDNQHLARIALKWMWNEMKEAHIDMLELADVDKNYMAEPKLVHDSYKEKKFAPTWAKVLLMRKLGLSPGRTDYFPDCVYDPFDQRR